MLQEWTLHTVAFCAPPLHNSLNSSFVRPFTRIVTRMQPLDHVFYATWASNWLIAATCILRGYPAGLLTILLKPFRSVSTSLRKDLGGFQKSAASFVIRSVLVSLLFMLQSPHIGFDNFAVIIASPVAAKEQRSNEAEITA